MPYPSRPVISAPRMTRISLYPLAACMALAVALPGLAKAQYRDFHNLELQFGFKNFKVDHGNFFFSHDTLLPDTSGVSARHDIGSPNSISLLSLGFETQLPHGIFLSTKAEVNVRGPLGGGFQIGAGYRFRLNYFMRIQPEILLSWGILYDTLGAVSYFPSPLTLSGIRFWEGAEITAIYRGQQYGFQPRMTFVADFAPKWEFRFTMMWQVALAYNQAVVLSGPIGPVQTGRVAIPFRQPYMLTAFEGAALDKALYRPSGLSARVGIAFKVVK